MGYYNDYDDHDFEWKSLKCTDQQNKIEQIECDLVTKCMRLSRYSRDVYTNIKLRNHPLTHFHRFSKLKSLKLKLDAAVFGINHVAPSHEFICKNLKDLHLEFEEHKNPKRVDGICKFVLAHCPNVT